MRKAGEGLGASNEAEGHPGDISLAFASSAPSDQDSGSALTSSSDEPSAGGTVSTTDVSRPTAPITRSDETLSIEIPSEEPRDRNDDDQGLFKLAKIFMGLTFAAALALMIYRAQTKKDDFPFKMVLASTLFNLAFTTSGMMLKNRNRKAAKFCSYAGIFWGALDCFLMLSIFAGESLNWLVWTVAGGVFLVFAYTIRRGMGI